MTINRKELLELCKTNPESVVDLIEKQDRIITELTARIVKLESRIAELEARLSQNSRNSSRPPSMDGFRRVQSPRKKGEKTPGGQTGHKGQTLEWVETPDQIEVHSVLVCEGCGTLLEQAEPFKVERRQVHDAEFKIIVTEHQAEHKQCPHCGQINRGHFPDDVQYPIQYGRNLKALMVYLCIYQLIPYERIREAIGDIFGCFISTGTLVNAVRQCSQNLAGVEEQIRELLTEAQVLHVDETGLRVTGVRQWLHVASTELLTWYGHHRKRGSQATDAMQILPKFRGTMIHDFWSPYFRYSSHHALCNAHLLRELTGISENYGQNWSSQLQDLIREIKRVVDGTREQAGSLCPSVKSEFLERYSQILDLGMTENPLTAFPNPSGKRGRRKQSKARNLLDRCAKFQNEILSFMLDFSIPFSNNQAERDLRMAKLQQKISGTFRSEEGAVSFCRIRGFISTAKKHKLPVLAALVDAFANIPFTPSSAHRTG